MSAADVHPGDFDGLKTVGDISKLDQFISMTDERPWETLSEEEKAKVYHMATNTIKLFREPVAKYNDIVAATAEKKKKELEEKKLEIIKDYQMINEAENEDDPRVKEFKESLNGVITGQNVDMESGIMRVLYQHGRAHMERAKRNDELVKKLQSYASKSEYEKMVKMVADPSKAHKTSEAKSKANGQSSREKEPKRRIEMTFDDIYDEKMLNGLTGVKKNKTKA
jgi:hypothetical protein